MAISFRPRGVPLPDTDEILECKATQHDWDRYQSEAVRHPVAAIKIYERCTRCTAEKVSTWSRMGSAIGKPEYRYPENWDTVHYPSRGKHLYRRDFIQVIQPLRRRGSQPA